MVRYANINTVMQLVEFPGGGESNGILIRGSQVRILPGHIFSIPFSIPFRLRQRLCLDTIIDDVVGVAQLVEPWIVVPVVAGSNPVVHPIFIAYTG
jgi:hypothetical protein